MKYIITFGLLLCTAALFAQAPDMERMKRDIEVGENILGSLLQENYEGVKVYGSNLFMGDRSNVEGSYLEGFGVLFTIAPGHFIGAFNRGEGVFSIRHDQAISITVPKSRGGSGRANVSSGSGGNRDTVFLEAQFQEVVETFAAEYAFLLRQLPADEKIMIRYGGKPASSGGFGEIVGFRSVKKHSAVLEKSDLDAFQDGRLNESQLLERIKYSSEEEGSVKEDRDLTLLTSIFSRLYQSDLSKSDVFRLRGEPSYERIDGVGAVVYLKVGSKFPHGTYFYRFNGVPFMDRNRDRERIRIVVPESEAEGDERRGVIVEGNADVVEEDEDAQEIDESYIEFMEELERNIVEYGSIVKELGKDEVLIFKVDFFDCKDCELLPDKVEITTRQPTLEAYRKGSISLDKAVDQLKITTEN